MSTNRLPSLLGALLLLPAHLLAAPGGAADASWPQWRGPRRDGTVAGAPWPAELSAQRLVPIARVDDLGPSYAGPVVAGGRVFTVETRDEEREVVRAFDRRTGEEVWEASWEGAIEVPFFAARNGSWVRSTPAYADGALYVGGMRDVLVRLDAETGKLAWRVDFPALFDVAPPAFGLVCSPLVADGRVYVQAGGSAVALDAETGEVLWRVRQGEGLDSAFSSPLLADVAGRRQLLVQGREKLAGLDPEAGAVLWSVPVRTFRGMNILTPLVHGDGVFTSSYGGRTQLLALAPADDGFSVAPAWDTGTQGYMTSPVAVDGHAYLFLRSNRFTCIDLATGAERWTSPPTGDEYWSLVAQGDRILALANTGVLRLIAATPGTYRVLGEVELSEEETWAHLAVAGDELWVRELHGLAGYRWTGGEGS